MPSPLSSSLVPVPVSPVPPPVPLSAAVPPVATIFSGRCDYLSVRIGVAVGWHPGRPAAAAWGRAAAGIHIAAIVVAVIVETFLSILIAPSTTSSPATTSRAVPAPRPVPILLVKAVHLVCARNQCGNILEHRGGGQNTISSNKTRLFNISTSQSLYFRETSPVLEESCPLASGTASAQRRQEAGGFAS